MFGYTSPLICELKVCEHNLYKSIYCGLCRTIKKKFSNLTTIFLSYDLVFFSIFAINFLDDKIEFEKKFCPIHPLKKKICLKQCNSLNLAADLTVIFSYFKLVDQLKDENFIKKIATKIALILMKRKFKKASSNQKVFAKIVKNFIEKQTQIEKQTKPSIDATCHPTAKCLSLIFKNLTKNEVEVKNLERFGYFLGRFIYLIDALDDLTHDFKLKNFNPFLNQINLKIDGGVLTEEMKISLFEKAFYIINLTLAQLIETYQLINLKKLKTIADNLVFLGLMNSQKKVFQKHNKLAIFKKLTKENKANS